VELTANDKDKTARAPLNIPTYHLPKRRWKSYRLRLAVNGKNWDGLKTPSCWAEQRSCPRFWGTRELRITIV